MGGGTYDGTCLWEQNKNCAKIEVIVFDQGGFSKCSFCNYDLDKYLNDSSARIFNERLKNGSDYLPGFEKYLNRLICPSCNKELVNDPEGPRFS